MSNALVRMDFRADVPERVVEEIVGSPDDGTDDYYRRACEAVEQAVRDDPPRFLEYVGNEPDVEVDM